MWGRRRWIGCAGRIALLAAGLPRFAMAGPVMSTAMAPKAEIGKPAPPFEVLDTANRARSLAEFKGRPVVLEWTSPSCPFAAAQYESGRMQELQKWAVKKGVVWLAVLSSHPSRSDYLDAAAARAFNRQRGATPTALLMDTSGATGHAYGAMTANHMFVIDRRGVLVYDGGIDDAMSTKADEVRGAHNFVRAALEDLLAGRKVRVVESEPAGCAISYAG
jgi:peroxiredoxin